MAGTISGGRKAARANKLKYGDDFYKVIGKVGGTLSRNGGFASSRELASRAGKIGGKNSRRGRAVKNLQR